MTVLKGSDWISLKASGLGVGTADALGLKPAFIGLWSAERVDLERDAALASIRLADLRAIGTERNTQRSTP